MIRIYLQTILLIVCGINTSQAQVSPLELMGESFLQTNNANATGKIKALVIGISKYRELPKEAQLNYAHSDAKDFYHFLVSRAGGGVDSANIKLLLNEDATAAEIYAGLDWLLDSERNDRIIIFFAGHGDVETRTVKQRGFLLAHDSPRAGYHAGGTVKVMDLHDYLETLVTKNKANVLLITDACRAGKLAGGDAGQSQTTASLQEQWGGITKILSSQPGEKSLESEAWGGGHGVFTYHLMDGMKGLADRNADGFVSLSELNLYLSKEVPAATGDKQNPIVSGSMQIKVSQVDALELALVQNKKKLENENPIVLASRNGTVKDTLSEKTRGHYRKFRDALTSKNLITKEKSALHYFKLIELENKENISFVSDIRRALVAALEANAQTAINRYMVNDKTLEYEDVSLAAREMQTTVDLLSPNDIRYKTLQARKLFLENGFLFCICKGEESTKELAETALAKLRASLKLEPDAAYVLNSMGNVHYTRKNYDSAKFYYLKAIEVAPRWSYPFNNLGTLHTTTKNKKEAIKNYETALSIDPDFGHIYNNLGNMFEGEKAIEYYLKALAVDSSGGATYNYNIGKEYFFGRKKGWEKGEEYFKKLANYPYAGNWYEELSDMMKELGDDAYTEKYRDMAIASYLKEIDETPDKSYLYFNLAQIYEEMDELELVEKNYRKAISIDPMDADYILGLGYFYSNFSNEEHSVDSAIHYLKRGLDLNPSEKSYALYALADEYRGMKLYDSAQFYIDQSIGLREGKDKGESLLLLSYIYAEMGEYESAVIAFEESLLSGYVPSSAEHNYEAGCYLILGDITKSRGQIGKAIALAKKNRNDRDLAESNYLLSRISAQDKKYDAALKFLEEALVLGYSDFSAIESESDFDQIHSLPKFISLVAKYKKK